jgi:hypothetical protein
MNACNPYCIKQRSHVTGHEAATPVSLIWLLTRLVNHWFSAILFSEGALELADDSLVGVPLSLKL